MVLRRLVLVRCTFATADDCLTGKRKQASTSSLSTLQIHFLKECCERSPSATRFWQKQRELAHDCFQNKRLNWPNTVADGSKSMSIAAVVVPFWLIRELPAR